jgi:hypothetical protein
MSEDTSALRGHGEEEPLLGRAGDASQPEGHPMYHNLIIGTGVVAQAGIWILVAVVWSGIFSHPLVKYFSPHPVSSQRRTAFLEMSTELMREDSY